MSNRRKNAVQIAEILRLKKLGHTQRKVYKILGISRNTVIKYWDLTQKELRSLDQQNPQEPEWVKLIDWDWVQKEVGRKTPRTILYKELCDGFPNQLPTYENFCRQLTKKSHIVPVAAISVPRERVPGRYMEIDYAGDRVEILIPASGELKTASLFVATLGYSSKIYAEFTWTQKLPDFIASHVNAFHFFGGCTEILVPDNCKTAVTKAAKEDPVINKSYQSLAEHYNTCVDPADPFKPRHKAIVEKSVQLLQSEFIAANRDKTYTSLRELNRDLKIFCDMVNDRPIKGRGQSRNELAKLEKLKPLPSHPFEFCEWSQAKVHNDCHIQLSNNFYSVPYEWVSKTVAVKLTKSMVYIYGELDLLGSHLRMQGVNWRWATKKEHYPPKAMVDSDFFVASLLKKSQLIGPNAHLFGQKKLSIPKHPLKNLRSMQSLIALQIKYSNEKIDHACSLALRFDRISMAYIKDCLKNWVHQNEPQTRAPLRQTTLSCLQGGIKL